MSIISALERAYLNVGVALHAGASACLRRVASTAVARTGLAALITASGAARAQEEESFLGGLATEVSTGAELGVNALNVGIFVVAVAVILGSLVLLSQSRISIAGVFATTVVVLILAFVMSGLLESGSEAAGEIGG